MTNTLFIKNRYNNMIKSSIYRVCILPNRADYAAGVSIGHDAVGYVAYNDAARPYQRVHPYPDILDNDAARPYMRAGADAHAAAEHRARRYVRKRSDVTIMFDDAARI
jgi:hypothetical protein